MSITDKPETGEQGLGTSLKPRHVTMISIAGVIGAGLFVGSANAIATAGPAVLLAYLFAGILVILVMRMLGEMATANPDTGSFSTYATRALGHWAGFSVGWLYWWFWVLVIPVEATAAAAILTNWLGGAQWMWALIIVVALTATNLISVGNYGEFEFWFALVKVVAIVAFIALGIAAILGWLPDSEVSGVDQLWASGGFMPLGFGAVIAAMLTTMFSFMGSEIVTIAAAESKDPAKGITRATNSVIWRISIFYFGSIFIIVALVPWNELDPATGSYQYVLSKMGIPHAETIMDIVILTAVASCLNSALYTASRMLYSLGDRGDAPRAVKKITSNGVPWVAVVASMVLGFLAVIGNYILPEKLFTYLLATTGAVALFVYLAIASSQLVLRRQLDRDGERPAVVMWLYPWLTYLAIGFIVFVLVMMVVRPEQRSAIALSAVLAAVTVIGGILVQRRNARRDTAAARASGDDD
ncbi:MAG: amino acid permease [Rhodococcus sp. (in: high G+C Gram-positive bacteria)]